MPDKLVKRLVLRLKEGDSAAFEKLFCQYHQKVFNFALKMLHSKMEAEGVVQNTFVKIWENRSSLDETHSFHGYLFKIAQNDIYNHFRKRLNEKYYREYLLEYAEKLESSLEEKINLNELEVIVEEIMSNLPERRREIFLLSRNEGLTYKEIGLKLNITENTVDTQIRKALDFFRQHLRNKYLSHSK